MRLMTGLPNSFAESDREDDALSQTSALITPNLPEQVDNERRALGKLIFVDDREVERRYKAPSLVPCLRMPTAFRNKARG
jgi:hypothetical protein